MVVDVGGGPGYFRDDFTRRGATYIVVDPDLDEMSIRGRPGPLCVQGDGLALPLRTGSVDVCFSSNALEHVPDPERFADEMVRVTRPGGLIYLAYTNWLSPNGGHETKPWHLVIGGHRAARALRPPDRASAEERLRPVAVRGVRGADAAVGERAQVDGRTGRARSRGSRGITPRSRAG